MIYTLLAFLSMQELVKNKDMLCGREIFEHGKKNCPWLDIPLPMMSEGEYRNEHGIKSTKMFNNL